MATKHIVVQRARPAGARPREEIMEDVCVLLERGESLQGACRQIRDATAVKDKLVNAAFENPSKLWCFAKLAAKYG